GAAGDDLLAEGGARGRVADDLEVAGVDEVVDEVAAGLGAALVENDRRHVADVGVDEAEEDELEDRHQESEAQGAGVAHHLQHLLLEDRLEASHEAFPPAACAWLPFVCRRVSRTKTSSSEAAMGRTWTGECAASSRARAISSSVTSARTRRWRALPKMVTSST